MCVYAREQSTPHVVSSPHPTLPAFCSAWPPACLLCVCVDPIPATIAIITAWGRASLFFASVTQTLCTLLPAFCNDSLSRNTPKTVCGKPSTCNVCIFHPSLTCLSSGRFHQAQGESFKKAWTTSLTLDPRRKKGVFRRSPTRGCASPTSTSPGTKKNSSSWTRSPLAPLGW